jgi:hypothetical protein
MANEKLKLDTVVNVRIQFAKNISHDFSNLSKEDGNLFRKWLNGESNPILNYAYFGTDYYLNHTYVCAALVQETQGTIREAEKRRG